MDPDATRPVRGEPLLAIAVALLGWIPVLLAAAIALGDGSRRAIAIALAVAGAASAVSVVAGVLGLIRTSTAGQVLSSVAVVVGGSLGIVTLVFVLETHW
jgi:hypothetical protein